MGRPHPRELLIRGDHRGGSPAPCHAPRTTLTTPHPGGLVPAATHHPTAIAGHQKHSRPSPARTLDIDGDTMTTPGTYRQTGRTTPQPRHTGRPGDTTPPARDTHRAPARYDASGSAAHRSSRPHPDGATYTEAIHQQLFSDFRPARR